MKALLTKQKMINKVILIPEYKIKPNPYQPRKVFDEEKIEQLATSIAQYGLLQPITVLPMEDGNYQLVAGERRLLACRRLKMQEVPAILTSMDEERSSALALVENIQRCDLNYFEEAMAIQKLMKMVGYTQQAVAKKLGKNQSTVANKLRLLQFSEEVREAILEAGLTERHARAWHYLYLNNTHSGWWWIDGEMIRCQWDTGDPKTNGAYSTAFGFGHSRIGKMTDSELVMIADYDTYSNYFYYVSTSGSGADPGSPAEKPDIGFYDFTATKTSVTVTYKIYNKDEAKVSDAKIYYGTTSDPTRGKSATVTGSLIKATISGLKAGTTYYVKCQATGASGTTTSETSRVITAY